MFKWLIQSYFLVLVLCFFFDPLLTPHLKTNNTFIEKNKDLIDSVQIDETNNMAYYFTNTSVTLGVPISSRFSYENKVNELVGNVPINYKNEVSLWNMISPSFGFILLLVALYYFQGVSASISKSAPNSQSLSNLLFEHDSFVEVVRNVKTSFDDVIGLKEVKTDLKDYIGYLKNRKRYIKSGFKLPKGLLFVGPPGTGKTLLARALAGEAKVTFIPISGSDFLDPFVGGGVKKIDALFKVARKSTPSIIFIDEIDAIGKRRSSSVDSHGEYGRTLNKLLTEMDGFKTEEEILVIAATNMVKILDPALTRSGRFDRKIVFDPPNIKERQKLFELYMKNVKVSEDLEKEQERFTDKLAKMTAGLSGADIANIVNQAVGNYIKRNPSEPSIEVMDDDDPLVINDKNVVTVEDLDETELVEEEEKKEKDGITYDDIVKSIDEVMVGMEKRERTPDEKERVFVAHHEAGHSLVAYILKQTSSPVKVSIVPRGLGALGYSQQEPLDKKLYTENELFGKICVSMGGRVAEALMFGHLSTGASNDLEHATQLASAMVTRYGMSDKVGPLAVELDNYKDTISNAMRMTIDNEIKKILDKGQKLTKQILNDNTDSLKKVAEYLLENEVVDKDDFKDLLKDTLEEGSLDLTYIS